MSKAHYSVNDDVYGKILKSHNDLKPQTDYEDVYEAVEDLGIFLFYQSILKLKTSAFYLSC